MRQRILMAVLIGVVGTLGCIAYMNAATNTSPRPANYRAAVMRVLDTQRVDYRDVEVVDGCAPSYQLCRVYSGKVRMMATTSMSRPNRLPRALDHMYHHDSAGRDQQCRVGRHDRPACGALVSTLSGNFCCISARSLAANRSAVDRSYTVPLERGFACGSMVLPISSVVRFFALRAKKRTTKRR